LSVLFKSKLFVSFILPLDSWDSFEEIDFCLLEVVHGYVEGDGKE